jgi:hypothetical protein
LQTNQFNGTIPKQIAQLKALTQLCDAELAYDFRASLTPSRAPCCRALSSNQFTGTIPTQIGQLTALDTLYVAIVRGAVSCSNHDVSSQVLVRQSIVWHNSDTNCAIDGARQFVRCDCQWWFRDPFTMLLQDLAQQSPHRTDSSVEFDNLHLVSDAFTFHLFDYLINSNQLFAIEAAMPTAW